MYWETNIYQCIKIIWQLQAVGIFKYILNTLSVVYSYIESKKNFKISRVGFKQGLSSLKPALHGIAISNAYLTLP